MLHFVLGLSLFATSAQAEEAFDALALGDDKTEKRTKSRKKVKKQRTKKNKKVTKTKKTRKLKNSNKGTKRKVVKTKTRRAKTRNGRVVKTKTVRHKVVKRKGNRKRISAQKARQQRLKRQNNRRTSNDGRVRSPADLKSRGTVVNPRAGTSRRGNNRRVAELSPEHRKIETNHPNRNSDVRIIKKRRNTRIDRTPKRRTRGVSKVSKSCRGVCRSRKQRTNAFMPGARRGNVQKSLYLGLRGGSQAAGLGEDGSKTGLGGAIGYRVIDPLAVEVSYINYGEKLEVNTISPVQASGKLFLAPWKTASPFVSAGVTVARDARATNSEADSGLPNGMVYGPHGGVGMQLGGRNLAVNVEGRYVKFSNIEEKGQVQGTIGVDFYF